MKVSVRVTLAMATLGALIQAKAAMSGLPPVAVGANGSYAVATIRAGRPEAQLHEVRGNRIFALQEMPDALQLSPQGHRVFVLHYGRIGSRAQRALVYSLQGRQAVFEGPFLACRMSWDGNWVFLRPAALERQISIFAADGEVAFEADAAASVEDVVEFSRASDALTVLRPEADLLSIYSLHSEALGKRTDLGLLEGVERVIPISADVVVVHTKLQVVVYRREPGESEFSALRIGKRDDLGYVELRGAADDGSLILAEDSDGYDLITAAGRVVAEIRDEGADSFSHLLPQWERVNGQVEILPSGDLRFSIRSPRKRSFVIVLGEAARKLVAGADRAVGVGNGGEVDVWVEDAAPPVVDDASAVEIGYDDVVDRSGRWLFSVRDGVARRLAQPGEDG